MMVPAMVVRGLTVRFGSFMALDNVDLTIPAGSRHAVIGPNGAGKTTLVHALTGRIAPAAGVVEVNGADFSGLPERKRVNGGLARTYQISQLFHGLSARDNVALAIFEREGKTRSFWNMAAKDAAVMDEADRHLAFVNLHHAAKIFGTPVAVRLPALGRDCDRARDPSARTASRRTGGGRANNAKRGNLRAYSRSA